LVEQANDIKAEGFDAAVVLEGSCPEHIPTVVLSDPTGPDPESATRLPKDADTRLIAGTLLGRLQASRHLAEMREELIIERAVKASAAKLFDEHQVETTLAVRVQRALLPLTPTDIDGVEVSVLYRPCACLSGDLYDMVRLDDDHLAFFLADACGHGIAAALLTMLIGRLLPMKDATHHAVRIVPPGEALARLNAAYVERQPDCSRLITAMYGILNVRTGEVTIAAAGHPPAAVVGPRGTRMLGDNGPALGMVPDAEFPTVTERLAPGETILLYSDGFEWSFEGTNSDVIGQVHAGDRRRPNDRYLQAFERLAGRVAGAHPSRAIEELATEMDQQSGSLHQPDDVTLLAITWRGAASQVATQPQEQPHSAVAKAPEIRAKKAA
jgi:serine phosphatase RsbU (regulator of sigma subunit)